MSDRLTEICATKRAWVKRCQESVPLQALELNAQQSPAPRGFVRALHQAQSDHQFGIIAEIKKASPSKGLIRVDFDPGQLAKAYQLGGANCLSVLTDQAYFQGSDADFRHARTVSTLPMLRKDFMVDPYQIVESRALGADCVLLILAELDDTCAREMRDLALYWGMDILLEVHDHAELIRAQELCVDNERILIGINNRNLKTLLVDMETCIALAPLLGNQPWVAESGIRDAQTMKRLIAAGAQAFLIGELLMRQQDVRTALKTLITEVRS